MVMKKYAFASSDIKSFCDDIDTLSVLLRRACESYENAGSDNNDYQQREAEFERFVSQDSHKILLEAMQILGRISETFDLMLIEIDENVADELMETDVDTDVITIELVTGTDGYDN